MICYDKIGINEGIDLLKVTTATTVWLASTFFNHGLAFQYSVCNGYHDFSILYLNISDIPIITVENVDFCCIIYNSKSEAINLLKKWVLQDHEYM